MRDGWSSSGKGWDDDAAPQQWMVVAGQPLATNLLDDVSGALQHGLIIFPTLPVRQLSRTFLPLLRRGRISDSEHYATLTLVGRPRNVYAHMWGMSDQPTMRDKEGLR